MTVSSEKCENQDEKFDCSTRIYRVISFQRLADILIQKENTLVHPSKWDDPFEGYRIGLMSGDSEENENEIKNYFGQCWTMEYKSDAMWKMYSSGTDGFRIRTTVGALLRSLKNNKWPCLIARVLYLPKAEINSENEDYKTHFCNYSLKQNADVPDKFLEKAKELMVKRIAFKHEREVRLICYQKGANQIDCDSDYIRYNICLSDLIHQIRTHPLIKEGPEFCRLKDTLEKLCIYREQVNIKIKRSELLHME